MKIKVVPRLTDLKDEMDEVEKAGEYLMNNKFTATQDSLQTSKGLQKGDRLMLPQQTQTENKPFLQSVFNLINDQILAILAKEESKATLTDSPRAR